jgi:hypothetical protein
VCHQEDVSLGSVLLSRDLISQYIVGRDVFTSHSDLSFMNEDISRMSIFLKELIDDQPGSTTETNSRSCAFKIGEIRFAGN